MSLESHSVAAESVSAENKGGGAIDVNAMDEGGAGDGAGDPSSPNAKPSGLPPLAAFEAKILHYKAIHAKIEEMKTSIEIGWLRINAQPIKQALSTWASKWVHVYTSFVQNQVTRQLVGLDAFMSQVRQQRQRQ